jgi:uncharacterized protein YutE (UPF0331/DUF86 family)
MIDEELLERKKDIIFEDLRYLENKDFDSPDFESVQAVKYSLQEIIEECLDIANHVIAARELGRAEDYSEMFEVLGETGVIEEKLADDLADMAKFRNLLVHRYGDIENEELQRILKEDLQDIREYMNQIDEKLLEDN